MKNLRVHVALFFVSLIYGATFTIAKEVMPAYIKPPGLIIIRVGGATLLFWITHSLFFREKIRDRKDLLRLVTCAIFGVAANMLLFFQGLSLTTPINASVIMVTTPLFVGIFAFIFLKEKVTSGKIAGLILGLAGGILLVLGPALAFQSGTAWGDFLVMVNAIIYAYYLIIVKPLIVKYYPLTVIKWTFLFGTIMVIPFGWHELTQVSWNAIPPLIYFAIAFLVVAATYLTYLLNGWALRYLNSSVVGAYIYLQPVLATFIAISLGKDTLSLYKIVSAGMIFTGVYLVSFTGKKLPG